DVLDGKVSLLRAREDYGVVIQPETLVLDQDATQRLRAEKRSQESALRFPLEDGIFHRGSPFQY
ncbi:MAG: hypothetical protein D6736_12670, partial [Nitrospinota bacterium]